MSVTGFPVVTEACEFAERLMVDRDLLSALDAPTPLEFVHQVAECLKLAVDNYQSIAPNRSVEIADIIIAVGTLRAVPRIIALGTMARGDSLKFVGRTDEAWQALSQAGQMYLDAADEFGWARTRIGRLYVGTLLNCVPEALADAARARVIFQRHGDLERMIRLDSDTAWVYNTLGEPRRALDLFRSTLAVAEGMGAAGQEYIGRLYLNIGTALEDLGEWSQALDYYERARARFAAGGQTLHLATAEANVGLVAQTQGHFRRALQLFQAALDHVGDHSPHEATKIKWHILESYLSLNRLAEARELARQIVADNRRYNDAVDLGGTLVQLATTEAELGDFAAARAALDEAEPLFQRLGATASMATIWLHRSRLALRLGDPVTAAAEAERASRHFEAAGQQSHVASAALLAGQAALAMGRLSSALTLGDQALSSARRYNVPALRYSAHLLLGRTAEALQAPQRAARHYQAAAATTERIQRGLTITLRPGFLEDRTEALRRLIPLYLRDQRPGQALAALEQEKAQLLLGYLANRESLRWNKDDADSRDLIAELEQLRAEHQSYYRLAHAPDREPEHLSPVSPELALDEVASRERRMRALTEQLYLRVPSGQAHMAAPNVSLGAVQQALAPDTMLIEYFDDGERLLAFCLSRNSLRVQALPMNTAETLRLLDHLQLNISAALGLGPDGPASRGLAQQARRLLQRLHGGLIAPLGLSPDAWQRLIVVPYGALHYLPFHLIFDGARHLIERHEVVVLPAAVLATRPSPCQAAGARVLVHSWDGRLPHTAAEARMVQAILGGEIFAEAAATRAALQAPPTQVLHLAAHGHYRLDQPDLSYVQLADGQLYTDDLLQQDLSYELVTLSACETGRARSTGGELIGLGRGFLYAGAGALLLSLWPVADAATLTLMQRIYESLRAGSSKAAALRGAQCALLEEDAQRHPAFWGAFQLVGDVRPLSQ